MMKERDNQKSRVYAMDSAISRLIGRQLMDKRQFRALFKQITAAIGETDLKLVFRSGGNGSFYRERTPAIHIGPRDRTLEIMLHEIAHHRLASSDRYANAGQYASHGPEFVSELLALVAAFSNVPLSTLLDIAERHRVSYRR